MQLGDKLEKKIEGFNVKYAAMAVWCNENNATIKDFETYVEIVKLPEPSKEEQEEQEVNRLKTYLSETDWMVIKCSERGLSMMEEYPVEYLKRQSARNRINEIKGE